MPTPRETIPQRFSSPFDVVVLAASLGGLRALRQILSALPARFPAPIIAVQHLSATYPSHLVDLLRPHTALPVSWAQHGERIQPGHIYLAPTKHHLLVSAHHTLRLSEASPVQFVRPAADVLLQSVAALYRERAIGVILTGGGRDGALGIQAIKRNGGRVLAQNKATAEKFDMPDAAIHTGCVDFVLPLSTLAPALVSLVMVPRVAALLRVPHATAAS